MEDIKRSKTITWYIAAFLIPIVMLAVVSWICNIYPFGSASFLASDLRYQYIDFYAWYQNVLSGDGSFFYSFSQSLGTNTWGQFAYYLSSPLNLVLLLFPQENLTLGVFILSAAKLGLIELAFVFYFRKRFNLGYLAAIVFALCITWSLWVSSNLRNPIWLDALICLPFMMLGIYKFIHNNSKILLVLSTALCIITNWYMAYMTVLFLIAFYFFERYWAGFKIINIRSLFKFGLCLFAALALCSFTFIPTVFSFLGDNAAIPLGTSTSSASIGDTVKELIAQPIVIALIVFLIIAAVVCRLISKRKKLPGYAKLCYAIFVIVLIFLSYYIVGNLTDTKLTTVGLKAVLSGFIPFTWVSDKIPQVYCSIFITLLCIAFFFSRHTSFEHKAAALILLGLMFFSLYLYDWYLAWCGFRKANGFFCRNSIFFTISMVWIAASYFALLQKISTLKIFSSKYFKAFMLAVFTVVVVDLSATAADAWSGRDYDQSENDAYVVSSKNQQAELDATSSQPYRNSKTFTRAKLCALNEGLSSGYLDLSSYSSAHNGDAIRFLNGLGYSQEGRITTRYVSPILLMDSLLGIKYVCTDSEPAGFESLDIDSYFDDKYLYENPYALGLGYLVSTSASETSVDINANVFERQNIFANSLINSKLELYTPLEAEKVSEGEWVLTIPANTIAYYYLNTKYLEVDISVNDNDAMLQGNWFQHAIVSMNQISDSPQTVTVSVSKDDSPKDCELLFYGLNIDNFTSLIDELKQNQVQFNTFEDGNVGASIVSPLSDTSENLVMLTTPYDSGWTVKVDGQEVDAEALFDGALMGVKLPADGEEHSITMTYISPGFVLGCIVSAATAMLMICIALFKRSSRRPSRRSSRRFSRKCSRGFSQRSAFDCEAKASPLDNRALSDNMPE